MKVSLVMAVTLDGKIGRAVHDPVDWTGSADKKAFVRLTRNAGVMIMGHNTFKTIGRPLPGRLNVVMTRNPEGLAGHDQLRYTNLPPRVLLKALEKEGYQQAALIGGSQINTLFAREHLIDEVCLTLAPRIFGRGLSLFDDSLDLELSLSDTERLDEDAILLTYRVNALPEPS